MMKPVQLHGNWRATVLDLFLLRIGGAAIAVTESITSGTSGDERFSNSLASSAAIISKRQSRFLV
jgi:hypothetical protein